MKNLFLATLAIFTLTISCQSDNENIIKEDLSKNELLIENEETPLLGLTSRSNFVNDFSRKTILNTKENRLKVPVNFTNTNTQGRVQVRFRIATRKSGCLKGIGFRCGNDLPFRSNAKNEFNADVKYDYKNGYVVYSFEKINWFEL